QMHFDLARRLAAQFGQPGDDLVVVLLDRVKKRVPGRGAIGVAELAGELWKLAPPRLDARERSGHVRAVKRLEMVAHAQHHVADAAEPSNVARAVQVCGQPQIESSEHRRAVGKLLNANCKLKIANCGSVTREGGVSLGKKRVSFRGFPTRYAGICRAG